MATSPQPNFYKTELARALRENSFGLRSYSMSPMPDSDSSVALAQAIARVELLEGWVIFLRLTFVGYEIIGDPYSQESQSPSLEISESIEDLLRALSPLYNSKYSERLMAKLLAIT